MHLRFEFGNRKNPLGSFSQNEWEKRKPIWKQTRGISVAEVKKANDECGEVDALWTREAGLPLAVNTADCVPLLFYRKDHQAIAAVHAGWEGALYRIIPNLFRSLPSDLNNPSEWEVKIGPSIRACCYEFGEDLLERFRKEFSDLKPEALTPRPRHLDLIAVLTHELNALGVKISSIEPECTRCATDAARKPVFFSYRLGDRKSRQYSLIQKD